MQPTHHDCKYGFLNKLSHHVLGQHCYFVMTGRIDQGLVLLESELRGIGFLRKRRQGGGRREETATRGMRMTGRQDRMKEEAKNQTNPAPASSTGEKCIRDGNRR